MLIDTDIAFHAYGKSSRHRTLPMVVSGRVCAVGLSELYTGLSAADHGKAED